MGALLAGCRQASRSPEQHCNPQESQALGAVSTWSHDRPRLGVLVDDVDDVDDLDDLDDVDRKVHKACLSIAWNNCPPDDLIRANMSASEAS